MDSFDLLTMVGGLALFLYGTHLFSEGLEKLSGGRLERILENLTNNRIKDEKSFPPSTQGGKVDGYAF